MYRIFILLILCISGQLAAQQVVPLYSGKIPNSTGYPMKEVRLEKDG